MIRSHFHQVLLPSTPRRQYATCAPHGQETYTSFPASQSLKAFPASSVATLRQVAHACRLTRHFRLGRNRGRKTEDEAHPTKGTGQGLLRRALFFRRHSYRRSPFLPIRAGEKPSWERNRSRRDWNPVDAVETPVPGLEPALEPATPAGNPQRAKQPYNSPRRTRGAPREPGVGGGPKKAGAPRLTLTNQSKQRAMKPNPKGKAFPKSSKSSGRRLSMSAARPRAGQGHGQRQPSSRPLGTSSSSGGQVQRSSQPQAHRRNNRGGGGAAGICAFVVEGINDTRAVLQRRQCRGRVIAVHGAYALKNKDFFMGGPTNQEYAVSPKVLAELWEAQEDEGSLMVLADPDVAGRHMRALINTKFESVRHAFIPVDQATSTEATKNHEAGNVGVEHASPEAIKAAIAGARQYNASRKPGILESGRPVCAHFSPASERVGGPCARTSARHPREWAARVRALQPGMLESGRPVCAHFSPAS
ncbi:hypothetical protein CYMTET_7923 [Cymbomonas tetramitiformis]|uniref:Toprim domain-containing protein n=1 Tax=Cymbomonas tetramitiformis TaxID=36881 RepID=A0AAE0GU98_9CHLO|nr:hypothetical protein CYMTET_7923 [Cymbomonas tetramitiformis]